MLERGLNQDRYWEDFTRGQRFQTKNRTISEEEVDKYIALTGDGFSLYPKRERGGRHVPGTLLVGITSGLVCEKGYLSNLYVYKRRSVEHHKPVQIGESMYVIDEITGTDDRPAKSYGAVVLLRRIFNQDDEVVATSEIDTRIFKRRC